MAVTKGKIDKSFDGGKSLNTGSPGDKSRFASGNPKTLSSGETQDTTNAGEFAPRGTKTPDTGVKQTDPEQGRFDKSK